MLGNKDGDSFLLKMGIRSFFEARFILSGRRGGALSRNETKVTNGNPPVNALEVRRASHAATESNGPRYARALSTYNADDPPGSLMGVTF